MRTQLRIVAGSLRGRKLICTVNARVRPTPQMVREAVFSILGDAVPGRHFFDVFAGTGVMGLEALSRGASGVTFIERDFTLSRDIQRHIEEIELKDKAVVMRTDAYLWAMRWHAPDDPVNIYISPPFADLEHRLDSMIEMVTAFQVKVTVGSVIVLQSERGVNLDELPQIERWDRRHYGRNELNIWVKEPPSE